VPWWGCRTSLFFFFLGVPFWRKIDEKVTRFFWKEEEYSVEILPNCDRKLGFWGATVVWLDSCYWRHIFYESSGEESLQFSPNLPSDALTSLAQKSCQFSPNLLSDDLASLAQKSHQFSPNLPRDALPSFTQKSHQFSQNLPTDALASLAQKSLPV